MRILYFLLFTLILSGCAHNKIRYVKVEKKEDQSLTQTNKQENKAPYQLRRSQEIVTTEFENQTETVEKNTITLNTEIQSQEQDFVTDAPTHDRRLEEEINTIDDEPSQAYKVRAAFQAEEDARKARTLMIWAVALLFAVIIPFASLASVIPFIIGTIRLHQSNRSNYITPAGERFSRTARILQIIYGVIILLSLILLAALISLIF